MKIATGSDHAGLPAKRVVNDALRELGHQVDDLGTHTEESCDYPDFAAAVARRVASGGAERGVLCCGTGLGMSMTANRVPGVRAAVCHNVYTAEMARQHNDANVLCLGSRVLHPADIKAIVRAFLQERFKGGRHADRIAKIHKLDG
jgi:RpiB/LacA/LacB family sugar-phosphate isomerase